MPTRVRTETLRQRDFTDEHLRELYEFSNALAAEHFAHFTVNAASSELVHIFRRADSGAVVGFQFWGTVPIDIPRSRAITGGKLRVLPEFRNRGLHLRSGLLFYLQHKARHPLTRYYRLSLASMFGFVSITGALAEYELLDAHTDGAIRRAILGWAADNHFSYIEDTGVFFVDIFTTPETFATFPDSYFDKPQARRYAGANPEFRTNGSYVAFWFRFTPRNLAALARMIARKS